MRLPRGERAATAAASFKRSISVATPTSLLSAVAVDQISGWCSLRRDRQWGAVGSSNAWPFGGG
jgi:hypothetical protein